MVAAAHSGAGGHLECLEITLAFDRLEADRTELAGNIIGRFLEFRRSGGAPAHLGGSEVLDVFQVAIGIDAGVFSGRRCCEKQNDTEIRKKTGEPAHGMSS